MSECGARDQTAHAVSDHERLALATALDRLRERTRQALDVMSPVERTKQWPESGNFQAQSQLQVTGQHHANSTQRTRAGDRKLCELTVRERCGVQPEQRIAAARDQAEARAHDARQY